MKKIIVLLIIISLMTTSVMGYWFGPEAPPQVLINESALCWMFGNCTVNNFEVTDSLIVHNLTTSFDYNVTGEICIENYCISSWDDISHWNRTDNNTYLSNTNDYVGIGTLTPSSKLSVFGNALLDTSTIGGDATLVINSEINKDSCINLTEGDLYGFRLCNDGSGVNQLKISNFQTDENYITINRDDGITTFLNTTKTTLSTDDVSIGGFMGVRLNNDNRFIKIGNSGDDISKILFDDNDQLVIGQETGYDGDGIPFTELMRIKREGGTDLPLVGIGTTNPTSQLHVVGDVNITGEISVSELLRGGFVDRYDTGVFNGSLYTQDAISTDSDSNSLFQVISDTRGTPQFMVQDGGSEQASFIARSFMVVNQNNTLLNSSQNNICGDWGFIHIDCNTSTTGADFGVTDDIEAQGKIYSDEGLRSHASNHGAYLVLGDRAPLYRGTNGEYDFETNIFCDYTANNFVTGSLSQWVIIKDETSEYNGAYADFGTLINSSCIELEHNPDWNSDFSNAVWVMQSGINMISQKGGFFEYYVGDSDRSKFKIKINNGTTDGGGFYIDDVAGVRNHKAFEIYQDMNGYSSVGQTITMTSSKQIVDKDLIMFEMVGDASNMNSSNGVFIDMNIIGQPLTADGEIDGIHMPAGMSKIIKVGSADLANLSIYYNDINISLQALTPTIDLEIFTNDNDVVYVGSKVNFTNIAITLATPSSRNINPLYYYCDNTGTWQSLGGVISSTNGFTQSGVIEFTNPVDRGICNQELDGTPFSDTDDYTYIAIQRTKNNIVTKPVLRLLATSGATNNMFMSEDMLRLSPTNTAPEICTSIILGAIYYDISEDDMCVCKTTGWRVMTDGSACT